MVGSKIVQRLVAHGYKVRTLSRSKYFDDPDIELFRGGIEDGEVLKSFMYNADLLFHCAAELRDESKMWDVNVLGTKRLLCIAQESNIRYLCYLSSAGVIGLTDSQLVDETSKCQPQNHYEKSKVAAEELVAKGIDRCSTFESPECFFVSCDHERFNTVGGLWSLYEDIQQNRFVERIVPKICLPIIVPYILRRLWRGSCNYGNVRYSSDKLLSTGFRYSLGVEGAVRNIATSWRIQVS